MQVRAALAIVLVVLGLGATPVAADEGDVDPAFELTAPPLSRTILLPDDRVLSLRQEPGEWELRRFTVDGAPDPTFGDGGVVHFTTNAFPEGVGADGDGRVVVFGAFGTNAGQTTKRSVLRRFLVDGALDTSYGTNGVLELQSSIVFPDGFGAVGVDGSVYVQRPGFPENEIRRVDPRGVVDERFGISGVVRFPGFLDVVRVGVDRIVVSGTTPAEHSFVAAYSLNGRHRWDVDLDLIVESTVLQPDGSVVIADRPSSHRLHRADGTPFEPLVLHRIRRDGLVDTSFGFGGQTDTGTRSYFNALVGGPDGRLYAWSAFGPFVRAFTPGGVPIDAYGECGWGGRGLSSFAHVVGVDHHSRVIVVATDHPELTVLRLQGDGGGPAASVAPGTQAWITTADGFVADTTLACWHGDLRSVRLAAPVVGIAATVSGGGYWLAASDGGIFAFGDAPFLGSLGGLRLRAPIVAISPTPSGRGYWLVASDGGVFTFGDAAFLGSLGGFSIAEPIVGMAPTRSGNGYWLVASDGGVFTFGDAPFFGAAPAPDLDIVGMAPTPTYNGYWLLRRNGGLGTFGDATVPNDRGSFVYSPAYSPGPAVAIEPSVGEPGFGRLFATCCPTLLGGRAPVAWDGR